MNNTEEGLKGRLVKEFNNLQNKLNGSRDSSLNNIRNEALNNFDHLGFPTLKHEEWKYTNISFLYKHDFNVLPKKPGNITKSNIEPFQLNDMSENLLVFVNGYYMPSLSNITSKAGKYFIGSISEAERQKNESYLEHFGKYAKFENDAFTSINTAYANDGAFIYISDNIDLYEPIHILYLSDLSEETPFVQPRNLVIVGRSSRVNIIETIHTIGDNYGMTNVVTEIYADTDSHIEYYKMQNDGGNHYYIGTTHVKQEKGSVFNSDTITLKGMFIRNNLTSLLNDEHCEANFNGLYYISGKDFVDNHTLADHAKPCCNSNEAYRGIIDDKATAVFNGKIMVRRDAQKTNAYQSNKNILLSNDATINTKPQLEIFADDVKCSHGATSGSIDEDSMFYLRARGIGKEKARALLLNAFAADIVNRIAIPQLRSEIARQITIRLGLEEEFMCSAFGN